MCSWESSQSPKLTDRVRLLAFLLDRPVTQLAWRPDCRSGETGSIPVQGARFGPGTGRRGNRLIRGSTQVRLLPARLHSLVEQRSARRPDMAEIAGSNPAETTEILPWPSGKGTWITPREFAGSSPAGSIAEWTGAWMPARSHKPYHAGSNPASATLPMWRNW